MMNGVKECDRCKEFKPEEDLDPWLDDDYREEGRNNIELFLCRRCSNYVREVDGGSRKHKE